jgi:hypothetical protein
MIYRFWTPVFSEMGMGETSFRKEKKRKKGFLRKHPQVQQLLKWTVETTTHIPHVTELQQQQQSLLVPKKLGGMELQ